MRNLSIKNKTEGIETVNRLNKNSLINTHTSEYNNTVYVSFSLYVLVGAKTIFALTKTNVTNVDGSKRLAVVIRKMTSNPFGVLGKEFDSFNEAMSAYKTPEIKLGLLKLEMDLS